MPYSIEFARPALRTLERLPVEAQRRVSDRIAALAITPRPPDAVTVQGYDSTYRIRVGDYRVIYQVQDDRLLVLVILVGHRRDVYRRLP